MFLSKNLLFTVFAILALVQTSFAQDDDDSELPKNIAKKIEQLVVDTIANVNITEANLAIGVDKVEGLAFNINPNDTTLIIDLLSDRRLDLTGFINSTEAQMFSVALESKLLDLAANLYSKQFVLKPVIDTKQTEMIINMNTSSMPMAIAMTGSPQMAVEMNGGHTEMNVVLETTDEQTVKLRIGDALGDALSGGSFLTLFLLIIVQCFVTGLVGFHWFRIRSLSRAYKTIPEPNDGYMVCTSCRANNFRSAAFCRRCGLSLVYHPPAPTGPISAHPSPALGPNNMNMPISASSLGSSHGGKNPYL